MWRSRYIYHDNFVHLNAIDPEVKNQLSLIFAYIHGYDYIFEDDWRVVVFADSNKVNDFIFDNQYLPKSIVYPLFMTIRAEYFKKNKEVVVNEP